MLTIAIQAGGEPRRDVRRQRTGRGLSVLLRIVLPCLLASQIGCGTLLRSSVALPARLTDQEFWSLITELSEPAGTFEHSDNLVSNEIGFVHSVRLLREGGGVYIGVGPEQNFSYIARLRPALAFIIDIRRENRNLHLMYKALFELSADRAEFLSRLFSRERAPDVGATTPVQDLFDKYANATADMRMYEANARLIQQLLTHTHQFPLSSNDEAWIEYAFKAFYADGPAIHYGRGRPADSPRPSYRTLMTAADTSGQGRSYLATEEGFAFVKDLHARNLIVPIVGDFAGPDAIRRAGDYIRKHEGTVRAFYGSNVEVYLNRQQTAAFCQNLAALPYDSRTWFIASRGMQPFHAKLGSCTSPGRR